MFVFQRTVFGFNVNTTEHYLCIEIIKNVGQSALKYSGIFPLIIV